MLTIKDVNFSYEQQRNALTNINLKINKGERICLLGRNGCGKTTLTKLIAKLVDPSAGEILFEEANIKSKKPKEMARNIGYVFQNPDRQLFLDTVYEEISYGPRQIGYSEQDTKRIVEEVMEVMGLTNIKSQAPQLLAKGLKQKVAIASAMAQKPKLIILDEPTTGQDALEQKNLMKLLELLKAQNIAVVMVTHDMDLAANYFERAIVLNSGQITFDGRPKDLFLHTSNIANWGLRLPAIVKIAQALNLPLECLSSQELFEAIKRGCEQSA